MRADWLVVALIIAVAAFYQGWVMGQNAQPIVAVASIEQPQGLTNDQARALAREELGPELKRLRAMIEAERNRPETKIVIQENPSWARSATAVHFGNSMRFIGSAVTGGW